MKEEVMDAASRSAIVNWYSANFDQAPVITVLVTLAGAIVLFWLLQKATKLALVLMLIAAALVGGSYLVEGEEKATERVRDATDVVEDQLRNAGVLEKEKAGKD